MTILYNLALFLYSGFISVASLFNEKARLWKKGRKDIFTRMQAEIANASDIYWFHSASLGEFEQGRTVIEQLRLLKPEAKILVTFFSPSGFEIRKNYPKAEFIFYLPIDSQSNAVKFLDIVKPRAAFFIKYEFWHHYICELAGRKIPVYCISANFRPNQMFFKSYGGWYRNILFKFAHLFVQNQQSANLLRAIGVSNVTVTGDTRFDRVAQIAAATRDIPLIEAFKNGGRVIIAGSTWPADERLLTHFINHSSQAVKFIIAPHEINESAIEQLKRSIQKKVVRYSQADAKDIEKMDVMIIDNIGMLSSIYKYGIIAYIGGGFGKGIHNILEAATFGLPVLFGPKYDKFQEAKDLIAVNGAFTISSAEQLTMKLNFLLDDEVHWNRCKHSCKAYVAENTGATVLILNALYGNQNA